MPNQISREELEKILTNSDTTQEKIEQLIERDPNPNLSAFNSNLKVRSQFGTQDINDQFFNKAARDCRNRKYQKKINGNFSGVKIVSEGDSWFQFPFLLKDVIDWLCDYDDYAIWSLDAAGDTLENMVAGKNIIQIVNVIREKNARLFMISGGGNDMFAKGIFSELLNSSEDISKSGQYFNTKFDIFINKMMDFYHELFTKLLSQFSQLKIVCHGYDYIIPRTPIGIFMGNNMQEKGIKDESLQKAIMKVAIDRLNEAQIKLVSQSEFHNHVFHVDCRHAVNTNNWFDEIHPNNYGFESVAIRFRKVIQNSLRT